MNKSSKIYLAGHSGLVGTALIKELHDQSFTNIVTRTHAELDLTNQSAVHNFFQSEKPEYVFVAAAKVGGIYANRTYPAEFIYQNLAIQSHVIHGSYLAGVKRLLFLGSSCIYPKKCPQPIKEDYLLSGPLEPTNRSYAIAKISGIEMCRSYNFQYRTQYLSVMPCNLYGPGDKYDLKDSHVLPALIQKMHESKILNDREVKIWGTGKPRREFLFSEDMARACILLMALPGVEFQTLLSDSIVNVGTGEDITIAELAELTAKVIGFKGKLSYDSSKPNGTMRKVLDVSKIHSLGWKAKTGLEQGIRLAYKDWMSRQ